MLGSLILTTVVPIPPQQRLREELNTAAGVALPERCPQYSIGPCL